MPEETATMERERESRLFVLHPSGICRRTYRKKRKPIVAPRKSSGPSVRGAQSSRDGALFKGKTGGKKRKAQSALLGDPLLRLPRNPPVHLRSPGFFCIFPLHQPSHPRQFQEAQQAPLPPRVVEECPDAPRVFAFPRLCPCRT